MKTETTSKEVTISRKELDQLFEYNNSGSLEHRLETIKETAINNIKQIVKENL